MMVILSMNDGGMNDFWLLYSFHACDICMFVLIIRVLICFMFIEVLIIGVLIPSFVRVSTLEFCELIFN